MKRGKWSVVLAAVLLGAATLFPSRAAGQDPAVQDLPGDSPPVRSDDLAASKTLGAPGVGTIARDAPPATLGRELLPDLGPPALTWVAVVVILVLVLRTKPLLCWHNLDGLMLALTAVLLPLRGDVGVIPGDPTGQTVQWWAYLLLCLIGLYWLGRGLKLLLAKTAPALQLNVSESGMVVLVAAGLLVALATIVQAPISAGSRDGLIGGICMKETGKLPYGDALRHDARSPLLYLLHAGAVELVEPTYEAGAEPVAMRWGDRRAWLNDEAWETVDFTAVRLVSALLFVLFFGALAGIGHRHHSVAVGQALVAIVCLFPGALECFARPDIMLPTTLLAWSIVFVTLPGIGGLLSVLLLVFAGLAWPWAWLALPVMLAYFFRRGWHALGAVVGLLAGVAVALIGITMLVAPTLPRYDGALAEAGIRPGYEARLRPDGTLVVDPHRPSETVEPTFKSWLWKFLLEREAARLDSADALLPNDAGSVLYRDVKATTTEAADVMQRDYREALVQTAVTTRGWVALRTLLEATWKPAMAPAGPLAGVWELWSADGPDSAGRWTVLRRSGKVVVGLLALLVAFLLIRAPRRELHQLTGGLLVVSAATLLISMMGPATNWVWLMPTALAALAAKSEPPAAPKRVRSISELPPYETGPPPRITVDD